MRPVGVPVPMHVCVCMCVCVCVCVAWRGVQSIRSDFNREPTWVIYLPVVYLAYLLDAGLILDMSGPILDMPG